MVTADELSPALRGKSAAERLRLVQAILDADRRGRFALAAADRLILAQCATQLRQGRLMDDALLLQVSRIVRDYERHLVALANREQ